MSTDNFISTDYHALSSEIENSVKSNSSIKLISKESAWLRCAISRAYYSAFLTLREDIKNNPKLQNILTNSTDDHQIIIDALYRLPASEKFYANHLHNLRKFRNHCDYDLPPKFEVSVSMTHIYNKSAQTLIKNSKNILNKIL